MDRDTYLLEVEKRLARHFSALKDGYKSSSAERHRLEGFMQGAVFMELATHAELRDALERTHLAVFGKSIGEHQAESASEWQESDIDYTKYDQPTHERKGR